METANPAGATHISRARWATTHSQAVSGSQISSANSANG